MSGHLKRTLAHRVKLLDSLAKASAVLGGLLLTVITLVTCVSLIGRNTIGKTIVGDFELTASAAGAAMALFLPWCQMSRGNIIVDFFTAKAPKAVNAQLDRLGALLLSAVMALVAWRAMLGGLNAWKTQAGSMMLGFPEWIVYALMVPPLVLTAVIALVQAVQGFEAPASEAHS
jgi:TRAP-type C4-dicarboxylate transport system permease small subunit